MNVCTCWAVEIAAFACRSPFSVPAASTAMASCRCAAFSRISANEPTSPGRACTDFSAACTAAVACSRIVPDPPAAGASVAPAADAPAAPVATGPGSSSSEEAVVVEPGEASELEESAP